MTKFPINLNNIDSVKKFTSIVSHFDCDLDLVSESARYVVDAKSIMGVFSLDLSKKLFLTIHSTDTILIAKIKDELKDFITA